MVQQLVLPIKDSNVLTSVQETLLDSFRAGRRNYTIFQLGKATLLRVSDVMQLKKVDVFNADGTIKQNTFIHDRKTGKANTLYLKPVHADLLSYYDWLQQQNLISEWLFPSLQYPERHITEKQFYKVMAKVGDLLGINYLGTHTMRKTGAYRVYMQSNYNIGLVMQLLNHSSEAMTLTYLGLDQASRETILDQINFG
ncbi:site-specific integrase [Leuconostoc mesenteroides]|uniref:site-specific integrase n=1 Tax=Leuconostoc TaxID=1243 RepID=UPI001CBBB3BC|nr:MULTISPECIES: site-specific integrase [Leuconostoc]MCG0876409.1 integrase [Lactiplantibacillus plantarum]MDN5584793.1 site-specific integrase [Lactobacillus sp.]MDN6035203.1 site-specific integrase [Lactococcus lactis]MBZ1517111.1 site-specific integrase [Leuconostoc mesenteroides]MBZ1541403.1 site-specific integrase [Leuconostoc mesenteroides]